MKWAVAAGVCAAAVLAGSAHAKDFRTMVLVGADGHSATVRPSASGDGGVLDSFFDFGSPFNRSTPGTARPRGPYVLVYLLASGGLPGIPGRFYPATRAACFSWREKRVGSPCFVPNPTLLRLLRPAWSIPRIEGRPALLDALTRPGGGPLFPGSEPAAWANATVALEMAFGRAQLARSLARKPRNCIALRGRWIGADARRRPSRFCLAPGGAWAAGRLYPLGGGVWDFVRLNIR